MDILTRFAVHVSLVLGLAATACGQHAAAPKSQQPAREASTHGAKSSVLQSLPASIDPSAKYLFYLHGRIIETRGVRAVSPDFGPYQYEEILKAFADRGFVVISEPRPEDTDHREYAAKVAAQVESLLKAGVKPENITLVGASKGGGIALYASSRLKNRDLNFVILAACGDFELYRRHRPDLWGNILTIWDYKDTGAGGNCDRFFNRSGVGRHREIEVKLGLGHGLLYRPLKEWVEPAALWGSQK